MTEKEILVERIIEDLKANIYDSEEYIFDLVKEALMQRTIEDLRDINV